MTHHAISSVMVNEVLVVTSRKKWLGLALMGASVLVALIIGALGFGGLLSTHDVFMIFVWCFLLGFVPGFVLHMSTVQAQFKSKMREDETQSD